VEEIENPYRWEITGALTTILIGALGFAVMVVPDAPRRLVQDWRLAVAIITSTTFLFIFGLHGLIHCCWRGYRAKKGIKELLAGNFLVHWRYNPEEWHRFAQAEWGRTKAEARIKPLIFVSLFLLIGLFGSMLAFFLPLPGPSPTPHPPKLLFSAFLLFGVLTGIILGLVFGAEDYLQGRQRYSKNMRTCAEVYIGHGGKYAERFYAPLSRWWRRLNPGGIEPGEPAILRLNVEIRGPLSRGVLRQLRVPIPRGKEDEATELAKRLSDHS